ncbi:MAG: ComEC/Rec2 family competence protein [Firmicutes bacterium]|nr:ComEC/Rec2 family competence protein [Bacillota bacterium]
MEAPLVWLAAGWAAGGLLAVAWRPPPGPGAWLAAAALAGLAAVAARLGHRGPALAQAAAALALLLVSFRLGPEPPAGAGPAATGGCAAAHVEATAQAAGGGLRAVVRLEGAAAAGWSGRAELFWPGGPAPVAGELWQLCGKLLVPAGADNPGGFDPRWELAARGVRARLEPEGRPRRLAAARGPAALRAALEGGARAVRRAAVDRLDRSLPAPEAAVLAALLLGERAGLDAGLQRAFQLTGLVHLLSVSGLHVGFLVPWLELPWRQRGLRARWLGLAAGLGGYALLAGGEAPVERAVWMALAVRGGGVLMRRPHAPSALALAFLLVTLARPERAGELGVQLSFLATAGLLALRPLLGRGGWRRLHPLPRGLLQALLVSLAAQAAILPLLVDRFGRAGPWGPLLNLAAGPLVALLLPAGLAGLPLAALHPALAPALAPAGLLAHLLRRLVEAGAALPGAERLLPPPGWAALPWYGALAALAALVGGPSGGPRRRRLLALAGAGGVALALLAWLPAAPAPPEPEVVFLAVGQGDATLVRMPDGFTLLVDAGPARASGTAEILRRMRVRRLDAVAISHADADHAGGLPDLLGALPVGELWIGDPPGPGDRLLAEGVARARARGTRLLRLEEGWVGRRPGLEIRALNPPRSTGLAWEQNDRSLVLQLLFSEPGAEPPGAGTEPTAPPPALLLAGDLPSPGEERLLRRHPGLRAELLKVAHHGSAGSTSSAWLAALAPREAVLSVGPNPYGHPAAATLARLRAAGARLWRTDRDGAVVARLRTGAWRLSAAHPAAEAAEAAAAGGGGSGGIMGGEVRGR